MRWSRGLSPLILIQLALLLSGTRVSAESPSLGKAPTPQSEQTTLGQNKTQQRQSPPAQTSPTKETIGTDKGAHSTASQTGTNEPEQPLWWKNFQLWQVLFDGVLVVETFFLAKFSFQLVSVTDEMKKATAQAAKAATLALRTDRPVLVVKFVSPKCKSLDDKSIVSSEVYFQNLGKGPAVIAKALSTLRVQRKDPLHLEPPDYSQCLRSWIDQSVVSPATTVSVGISNALQLSSKEFEHVTAMRWTIVAYGLLSYRDPAFEDDEYEIAFQWIYRPPRDGKPDGDFLLGYAEHQRWN
jgi:hypothetical protein